MRPVSMAQRNNDHCILDDRQNNVLTKIKVEREASEFFEEPLQRQLFYIAPAGENHSQRDTGECADLFEQFLGRDREAVGDLGRAIEDLQDVVAQRTAEFAR